MSLLAIQPAAIKRQFNEKHSAELYPTDATLVKHAVTQLLERFWHPIGRPVRVLDLCAGTGVWGIYAKYLLEQQGYTVFLHGIEIDPAFLKPPEFDVWDHEDILTIVTSSARPYDIILSNPPFSLGGRAALVANRLRAERGIVMFLLGSTFPFSNRGGRGELFETYSIGEITYLLNRPGFYFTFAEKVGLQKPRGTNATEHCLYQWDNFGSRPIRREQYEYYDSNDPIHKLLQERPSTVICALAYEAAKERAEAKDQKREPFTFDHYAAKMAANRYGWDFYYANYQERYEMIEETNNVVQ